MKIALLVLAGLLGSGCKLSRWKGDTHQTEGSSGDATAAQVGVPQRVGDPANGAGAVLFDVDDKTGRPKPNLVLRLDFFPEAQPGGASLPACYKAFPADFDLGTVTCQDDPSEKETLTAANVEQDCYTDPKAPRTSVVQPVELAGCKKGMVLVHTFNPPLHVDVEVVGVN